MTVHAAEGSVQATRPISVQVSFPVSRKGPYRADVTPATLVETVRQAAMTHFEVSDGAQFTYVLTHDGRRQANDQTVGQVAGEKHSVDFRLVKEITQG